MANRYERNRDPEINRDGWRDDNDVTWDTRDRGRDEGRSWAGAERESRRSEGYGQYSRDNRNNDWRNDDWGGRASYDRASGHEAPSYDPSRSYGATSNSWSRGYGSSPGGIVRDQGYSRAYGQNDHGRGAYERGYGPQRDYYGVDAGRGGAPGDHAYAPGSQIWDDNMRASGRQRDYEPDYLHWREQQMSRFDRDYDDWRAEKRQKFSSDFDTWRTQRANPIVENISDGGTGSQKDIKNG